MSQLWQLEYETAKNIMVTAKKQETSSGKWGHLYSQGISPGLGQLARPASQRLHSCSTRGLSVANLMLRHKNI